jgi:hypothetical protein
LVFVAVVIVGVGAILPSTGVAETTQTGVGETTQNGSSVYESAPGTADADNAVDIVFVFDNSASTDEDRYHLARSIDHLETTIDGAGIDARYGLVTYNASTRTELPPTRDFDAFDRAMHFPTAGTVERASDAIEYAARSTAPDRETVIVVVTDEDDDSANTTRELAIRALADVHFVAVSPATPHESSCAVHSPPCDSRSDNELRTIAAQAGGHWIDERQDAETIVDRIGSIVDVAVTGESTVRDGGSGVEVAVTGTSTNRTSAEVGDPVAVTQTVRNIAGHDTTYYAFLSYGGYVRQERRVDLPEGAVRNVTFVHRFDELGRRDVRISHVPVARVDVVPPRNPTVELRRQPGKHGVVATVRDARANGSVGIPLGNSTLAAPAAGNITTGTVHLGAVAVRPDHDVAFDVGLQSSASPPNGTRSLPDSVAYARYVTINTSLGPDFQGLSLTYVPASNETTIYRQVAGEWVPLDRNATRSDDGRWRSAPLTGPVAIGVRRPAFALSEVRLDRHAVEVGETVTMTAAVVNEGTASGQYEATATVGNRTIETASLALDANRSGQLSFEFSPDRPGEYALAVDGVAADPLQVEPAPTATPSATPRAPQTTARSTTSVGNALSGMDLPRWVSLFLVLAIAITLLRRYRR